MKLLQAENRSLRALAGRCDGCKRDKSGCALVACVEANRAVAHCLFVHSSMWRIIEQHDYTLQMDRLQTQLAAVKESRDC